MSTPSINNSSATQTLPIVALVLDIDGVFNTKDNPTTIYEKVKSLQEKNLSEEARKTEEISYQFDMDAIKNLMHIINTLTNEKIARVIIVISSSWRKKGAWRF